jgi:hypothetical protein
MDGAGRREWRTVFRKMSFELPHPDAYAAHRRKHDAGLPYKLKRRLREVPHGLADRDRTRQLSGIDFCEGPESLDRVHILCGDHAIKDVWL